MKLVLIAFFAISIPAFAESCEDIAANADMTIVQDVDSIVKETKTPVFLFSDKWFHGTDRYPTSPDGRIVLLESHDPKGAFAVDRKTRSVQFIDTEFLGDGNHAFAYIQWSQDSSRALVRGYNARLVDFTDFLANGKMIKTSVPMTELPWGRYQTNNERWSTGRFIASELVLSADGTKVFDSHIRTMGGKSTVWNFPRGTTIPSYVVKAEIGRSELYGFLNRAQSFSNDGKYVVLAGGYNVSPGSEETFLRTIVFDTASGRVLLQNDGTHLEGQNEDSSIAYRRAVERASIGYSLTGAQKLRYEVVNSVVAENQNGWLNVHVITVKKHVTGTAFGSGSRIFTQLGSNNNQQYDFTFDLTEK